MRKDKNFKEKVSVDGFNDALINKSEYYHPDKVLANDDTIIIMECSSTYDRKTHIGELSQFLCHINTCYDEKRYILVIFLSCVGPNAPKATTEKERLQSIYNSTAISPLSRKKIKGIYIADYDESSIDSLSIDIIAGYESLSL